MAETKQTIREVIDHGLNEMERHRYRVILDTPIYQHRNVGWDEIKPFPQPVIALDGEITMQKGIKTIRDARGKHYEIFHGPDNAKRGQKEGILKYIETLGSETHTDVSEWELDYFMSKGQIITDKREVNSRFFKMKKEIEAAKPKKKLKKISVSAKLLKALSSKLAINNGPAINALVADNKYRYAVIGDNKRSITELERAIVEAEKNLEILRAKPREGKDYGPELRSILKQGNFTLKKAQPADYEAISFITKPIIKSFFSKEQATNLRVPMGRYQVDVLLNGQELTVQVSPYADNLKVGNYWHPHIQGGKNLCFGDVRDRYRKACRELNLLEVMDAVWDVLANFEDRANDGYMPLYRYEEEYKKKLKTKEGKDNGKTKEGKDNGKTKEGKDNGKTKQAQEIPY